MKAGITAESVLNDVAKILTSEKPDIMQDVKKSQEVFTPIVENLDGTLFTTSLNVAKVYGKRHADVLRSVEAVKAECQDEDFNQRNFALVDYMDAKGEIRPMYRLSRDGLVLLVMGYNGPKAMSHKLAYMAAFNGMEAELKKRQAVPSEAEKFLARLNVNQGNVTPGYFSIFHELARIAPELLFAGVPLDEHTMPDVSVGAQWRKHWFGNELEKKYGPRRRYNHYFPACFPQAKKNPVESWEYPLDALPDFIRWLNGVYIPVFFPLYMQRKVRDKEIPAPVAAKAIAAFQPKAIEEDKDGHLKSA